MDALNALWGRLLGTWNGWSMAQRGSAVAILVVGGLAFAGMLSFAGRQTYVPLMTNLTAEDAGQIVERLRAEQVPYQLTAGGTAVMVPEPQVHELRLQLAGAGLPRGGNVGFEIFDEPSFGMSHFAEQLNYRRALEGELRRTIRQIDAVRDARVHIVVPEQALFRDEERPATAAVTLALHPGRRLGDGQAQAITHLVAAAVAGLAPEQVTLVDSAGTLLVKGGSEAQAGGSALERQRAVERALQERVQQILVPVVGEGHVVARVAASLDFGQTDRTTETYDPQSATVRSEQFSEEKRQGGTAGGPALGIPGTRSNLTGTRSGSDAAADPAGTATGVPGSAVAAGGAPATAMGTPPTPSNNERKLQTRNFEINRIMLHEVGERGRLRKLSVAVLVDGIPGVDANGAKTVTPRSPEEMARLTELVRRTVGFDEERDDQVSVQSMAFEPAAADAAPEAVGPAGWVRLVERFWAPSLATLATLGVLAALLRARGPQGPPTVLPSPRTVREMEAALAGAATGEGGAGLSAPLAAARLGSPVGQVRPPPEQAADVLRGWLSEV